MFKRLRITTLPAMLIFCVLITLAYLLGLLDWTRVSGASRLARLFSAGHTLRSETRIARLLGITSSMGVARRQPVEKIVRPFQDFAEKQSSGGILLIAATVAALVWANSPRASAGGTSTAWAGSRG